MLRLVSNANRSEWEQDYAVDGQMRDDPREYRSHFGRTPRRRSILARLAITALIALTAMSVAVAVYLAAESGVLDRILKGNGTPAGNVAAQPTAPQGQEVAQASPVPDVPILVLLIRNALASLHQANLTGNYAIFRQLASPGLQAATTPAGVAEAFADLRRREVDLSVAASANPRLFAPPQIGPDGRLELAGFLPGKGEQINFTMSFEPVDGRWRLFGIGVNPVPPAEAASEIVASPPPAEGVVPPDAQLLALIRNAIIALNQANIAADYSVLRELGAPGFREANPAAALAENFAGLRARGIDLGPVAVIEPRLARPPAIDGQGYLRLTGFFPSEPEQVNFDLAFDFSEGAWRLFGIGLNTSAPTPQTAAPAEATAAAAEPAATPAPARATSATIQSLPVPRLRPQIQGAAATP